MALITTTATTFNSNGSLNWPFKWNSNSMFKTEGLLFTKFWFSIWKCINLWNYLKLNTDNSHHLLSLLIFYCIVYLFLSLLKAQVPLQFGKVFSSDNGVSVYIMYSYMYWLLKKQTAKRACLLALKFWMHTLWLPSISAPILNILYTYGP